MRVGTIRSIARLCPIDDCFCSLWHGAAVDLTTSAIAFQVIEDRETDPDRFIGVHPHRIISQSPDAVIQGSTVTLNNVAHLQTPTASGLLDSPKPSDKEFLAAVRLNGCGEFGWLVELLEPLKGECQAIELMICPPEFELGTGEFGHVA